MHDSVDLEAIGRATPGAVGSDLANMINEAAILAVKKGRTVVTQDDLYESVEVVIAGKEKKDRILGDEEVDVAYHEVGHALVTALIVMQNQYRRLPLFQELWDLWDMLCKCQRKKNI